MKKLIGLFLVVMMVFSVVPAFAEGGIDLGSLDYIDSTLFEETCIKCGGGTSRVYDLSLAKKVGLSKIVGQLNDDPRISIRPCNIPEHNKEDKQCGYEVEKINNISELQYAYSSIGELKSDFQMNVKGEGNHDKFWPAVKDEYAQVILETYYTEVKLGDEKYYIYKDLLTELEISEEGRLFYIKGESLSLGQAIGMDLYVNERVYDDNDEYVINKMKISSVYTDGLDPHYQSLTPNNNNEIGNENFWVCDSCAKCDACEKTVASTGSDTILAIYCPEHLCDFFWDVDTGDSIEGLFCKEGKKAEGSYFCIDHKCVACQRPITGVNLEPIINADFISNNYAGPDESMYSNYCIEHYCLKPYCRNIRANNNAGYGYCRDHLGRCVYPDCANFLPNTGDEKLCDEHRLNEFIVCEGCGNTIFDKTCPQCTSEVIKCKRCDNIIKDGKCKFCGSEEESWKDNPRAVICEHIFDGKVRYEQVGKFGDDNFGHIVIGHCIKCDMNINEWEPHSFDENGKCKCGYTCDHEYHMKDNSKDICVCIKCGNISKHQFKYQDEKACYCALCGYTVAHNYINQDKERCGECEFCGNILLHDYDITITYNYTRHEFSNNNGSVNLNTHHVIVKKCKNCDYTETDSGRHTFIVGEIRGGEFESNGEECTICGFKKKCVYDHYYGEECKPFSQSEHESIKTCVNCGYFFTEYKPHEYIDGKCYKCDEVKNCGHNKVKSYDYDNYYYHRIMEYCTTCKITFDRGLERHVGMCEKCSLNGVCQEDEHVYNIVCEAGSDSVHHVIEKCIICGEVKYEYSFEEHYWVNGKCSKCGYIKECIDDSGHRYIKNYEYVSDQKHKVIEKCAKCGVEETYTCTHTLVHEGFLTSSFNCKECGYIGRIGALNKRCKNGEKHICERTVSSLNDKKHEIIYTCGVCDMKKTEKKNHDLYTAESSGVIYMACRECDFYLDITPLVETLED